MRLVKNRIERIGELRNRVGLLTFIFLLGTVSVFAQADPAPADTLSGKYEGTIKAAAGAAEEKLSLELKNDGGKVSGRVMRGSAAMDVTDGNVKGGTLSLSFGKDAVLTAKVDGDKLVGDWLAGTQKRAIELKKVPAAAAAAAVAPAAALVNLSGQWDAIADANGQPFPFLLVLKVEGEGVSGSSSSQLGEATIKTGSWKDGRLSFEMEGQNGTIAMTATVIEGKLSGEFDFAGQLQGKWVAVRKN
jgi:hypothetical protein